MSTNANELLEKLSADIDDAKWDLIDEHYKRGAVLIVDQSVELVAVGVAMAKDQIDYIRNWLANNQLSKPEDSVVEFWKESDVTFRYLIIQPYVLIQLKKEELV